MAGSSKLNRVFLLIMLASMQFFNPLNMLEGRNGKLIYYLLFVFGLWYVIRRHNSANVNIYRGIFPFKSYYFIIFGIATSVITASLFHAQSWNVSIMTTIPYFISYFFLWVLLRSQIPPENMVKIIITIGIMSVIVMITNIITSPNFIFGEEMDHTENRAGLTRVRTPFMYLFFLFFYSIRRWKNNGGYLNILLIALTYVLIFLTLARQYMLYSLVLGFIYAFNKMSLQKKITIALSCFAFVYFVALDNVYVKELIKMSEEQIEYSNTQEDDVRIVGYAMFIDVFQTNEITRIFGNGVPSYGNSYWGNEMDKKTKALLTYVDDVGWAGFYFYFGLLPIIGFFSLIIRTIRVSVDERSKPALFSFVCMVLFAFAGSTVLYFDEIVVMMAYIYLVYAYNSTTKTITV